MKYSYKFLITLLGMQGLALSIDASDARVCYTSSSSPLRSSSSMSASSPSRRQIESVSRMLQEATLDDVNLSPSKLEDLKNKSIALQEAMRAEAIVYNTKKDALIAEVEEWLSRPSDLLDIGEYYALVKHLSKEVRRNQFSPQQAFNLMQEMCARMSSPGNSAAQSDWGRFNEFSNKKYVETKAILKGMILGGGNRKSICKYLSNEYVNDPYLGSKFNSMLSELENELIHEETSEEGCKFFTFLLAKFPCQSKSSLGRDSVSTTDRDSSTAAFGPTPTAFGPMALPTQFGNEGAGAEESVIAATGRDSSGSFGPTPVPTPIAFGPMTSPTQFTNEGVEAEESVAATFEPIVFDDEEEAVLPEMCSIM